MSSGEEGFDLIFGTDWPVVLRVVSSEQKAPVAWVVRHPVGSGSGPGAYWWRSRIAAAPQPPDPRTWRPVFGRLMTDPRWALDGMLPARVNGSNIAVDRGDVLEHLNSGKKKMVIRDTSTDGR
jgi:hypothetical protein